MIFKIAVLNSIINFINAAKLNFMFFIVDVVLKSSI